jgi:hypothetical protein
VWICRSPRGWDHPPAHHGTTSRTAGRRARSVGVDRTDGEHVAYRLRAGPPTARAVPDRTWLAVTASVAGVGAGVVPQRLIAPVRCGDSPTRVQQPFHRSPLASCRRGSCHGPGCRSAANATPGVGSVIYGASGAVRAFLGRPRGAEHFVGSSVILGSHVVRVDEYHPGPLVDVSMQTRPQGVCPGATAHGRGLASRSPSRGHGPHPRRPAPQAPRPE